MKTTVEIADPILDRARELAARDGVTLRKLIETGLRLVLEQQPLRDRFRLRDSRFGGRGLRHEYRDGNWHQIRAAVHGEPQS
jgi:hypothetical protein